MRGNHTLKLSIEEKRKLMIDAANNYGFNAAITIKHSQELDDLLNQYRSISHEKEKEICY